MDSNFIKEGDYVLIKLPSTNVKMVIIKGKGNISLGKFGTFDCKEIIGKPYGLTYEIVRNKIIVMDTSQEVEEIVETEANNRNALDDSANQKLTYEEIEELKKSTLEGEIGGDKIIEKVVANHTKFEEKTEYSKAKYIKRKAAKYLRCFTPIKPSLYTLCEFYFKKNPSKINDLRMDSLSQMMSLGNVFPGCRMLVVDDTQGLLVASILQRLGGVGMVVAVHHSEFPNYDIVRYFNFTKEETKPLTTIRWDKLASGYVPEPIEDTTDQDAERLQKRIDSRQEFINRQKMILEGGFDGLFIASGSTIPQDIVKELSSLLAPSRPVVLYNMYKEPLAETAIMMRESKLFLNPRLTECWLREYQVLPGRTHPEMGNPGASGFLLNATTIIDLGDATPISSKVLNEATKKARLEKE